MTQIIYARIPHPNSPNTLADPARVIGMSLLTGILELQIEAERKGYQVDWSSFEVGTDVDYLSTRTLSGADDQEFEIRSHHVRVRAQEPEATS